MAQLNPEKISMDVELKPQDKNVQNPKKNTITKFEDLLDEELPQVAQIEYILNHDLVKQSREFFKQEISKTMEGVRDANTKEIQTTEKKSIEKK